MSRFLTKPKKAILQEIRDQQNVTPINDLSVFIFFVGATTKAEKEDLDVLHGANKTSIKTSMD